MRVVHVVSDAGVGGAGRYLLALLAQPQWQEDELSVWLPPGALADRLEQEGRGRWQVRRLDMRPRSFDRRALRPLARALRQTRPDVVHAHASLTARLAAAWTRVPLVLYTRHGSSQRDSAQWRAGRLRHWRLRAAAWLRQPAVAISHAIAADLRRDGVPAERIHVIPPGINLAAIRDGAARRDAWRTRLAVPAGALLVVGVGRLVAEKNWAGWFQAAQRATSAMARDSDLPALQFAVAGTGPDADSLLRTCREAGLPDATLLGFVEDVPGLLAAADIFMLLPRREGLGLAVVEAMAAGLPVIVSDAEALTEVVHDGETGLVIPDGAPRPAAEGLLRLAGDDALRRRLARAGRDHAAATYSAAAAAARMRELYSDGLSRRRGSARPKHRGPQGGGGRP